MDHLLYTHALHLVFFAVCFYVIAGATYRLRCSPIAHYPGPRLAASTFWYEFYYDVVCKGRYSWKIQQLHQIYGKFITKTEKPPSLTQARPGRSDKPSRIACGGSDLL